MFGKEKIILEIDFAITGYVFRNRSIFLNALDSDGFRYQLKIATFYFSIWKFAFGIKPIFLDEEVKYILKNFKYNKTDRCSAFDVRKSKLFWREK